MPTSNQQLTVTQLLMPAEVIKGAAAGP